LAERKIAEYRSKVSDDSFSVYADTTRNFGRLLSFDTKMTGSAFQRIASIQGDSPALRPLFRFTYLSAGAGRDEWPERVAGFLSEVGDRLIVLSNGTTDIDAEELVTLDRALSQNIAGSSDLWQLHFRRGITQSLIRQYTNSTNTYSAAIELNPANPFLYLNRSATQAEMIDFIASIDNSYNPISVDSDTRPHLRSVSTRTYSYDDAIEDLNKAAKLYPEFAHVYYNRATLHALSGQYPEAFEDYSRAIELSPALADAWFNRGLVQIYMKDTRKGLLDLSKAGELGIREAYTILSRYSNYTD
jgi:tetratricopeptide (TPR) repeat protein